MKIQTHSLSNLTLSTTDMGNPTPRTEHHTSEKRG